MFVSSPNTSSIQSMRWLCAACMHLLAGAALAGDAATLKEIPYALEAHVEKGSFVIRDEQLLVTAAKGTDFFTDANGASRAGNAPRVWFAPQGDFILTTRVDAEFPGAYDGAGLIVYINDDSWAKFLFERFESGKLGVSTTVSNGKGDDAYHNTYESSSLYLKVTRSGDVYVFYVSRDGKDWSYTRSFSLASGSARVGFLSQSPFSASVTAAFSGISFRAAKVGNFWQGEP